MIGLISNLGKLNNDGEIKIKSVAGTSENNSGLQSVRRQVVGQVNTRPHCACSRKGEGGASPDAARPRGAARESDELGATSVSVSGGGECGKDPMLWWRFYSS